MSTYAIGDVQGCYDALQRLLKHIAFDEQRDQLWFSGDLVNRGPQSLEVLRFVYQLSEHAICVLGNHDLHFLAVWAGLHQQNSADTLDALLAAKDCDVLANFLRQQRILYYSQTFDCVLTHAGISPQWTLTDAIACAAELEQALQGPDYHTFLQHMYGNQPNAWRNDLQGYDRLRYICNAFTRMRYCDVQGHLELNYKGPPGTQQAIYMPWFQVAARRNKDFTLLFGHWASLEGKTNDPHLFALDTGCVWGGKLSALRLDDMTWFRVS